MAWTKEEPRRCPNSPPTSPRPRRRFDDAGIKVVGINTGVHMVSLQPAMRAKQMEAARANLAIAQGLGADYLRV